MSGKIQFKKYKNALNIISKVFAISPLSIRYFLWDCSSISSSKLAVGLRYSLLKSMSDNVGDNVYIGKYVTIKNFHNIQIGNNVSIHDCCYIDGAGELTIGNNVSIAHHCSILTVNHQWNDSEKPIKYNSEVFKPVVIHDDTWLGCGVRVLAGVTIASRSILAAGSIVNKNVEPNSIYGGVPAKLIKNL